MSNDRGLRPQLLDRIGLLLNELRELDHAAPASDAGRNASTLQGREEDDPVARAHSIAALAKRLYRIRRLREAAFGPHFEQDGAWDMLLDLFIAEGQRKRVSVSSLCAAAGIPQTSGIRVINGMIEAGLIVRIPDPLDRRRVFIDLTDEARNKMGEFHLATLPKNPIPVIKLPIIKSHDHHV